MNCRCRFLYSFAGVVLFGFAFATAIQADEPPNTERPTEKKSAEKKSGTGETAPTEKSAEEKKTTPAKESEDKPDAAPAPIAPRIDPAAELLQRLTPEKLRSVAEMIEQDWPERPEWAEMALAVMRGQATQGGAGWWKPTEKKYGWTWLKRKYDKNADNVVERGEFETNDAAHDLYFRRLDRDLDGKVGPPDFDVSVFQGATPAAMKARMMDFIFFRLDTDSNGQVTKEELAGFFDRADREKSSFLTVEDLLDVFQDEPQERRANSSGPSPSQTLSMFLSGQLGWFEEGPKLGDPAPNFSLATHDQKRTITLSDFREKKPVVLIFGSFT